MGAITGTLGVGTELASDYKMVTVTATVESADDDITLTEAVHGIKAITAIVSCVATGGLDAAWTYQEASFSGLVINLVSLEQDGTASTAWTTTTVSVTVIGTC